MKRTAIIFIIINILCLNTTAFAQLKQTDLDKINALILASEKRMKEYMDIKIDTVREEIKTLDAKLTGQINALDEKLTGQINTVDGRVSLAIVFVVALIALIAVAVGLPQFLLARREKEEQANKDELKKEILELKREIEKLKQERSVGS